MKNGVDISKWQGTVNWQKAKESGVEFAILREGYGKKSPKQVDKMFKENYTNAKAVNIPVGAYHYSYAESISDAKLEAQFCLENILGMQFEYPICFDIEDSEMLVLSNQERTDICKAFCETIENSGYYAMIYCSFDWYKNKLYGDELAKDYDVWLAQWNVSGCDANCGIWQKSSSGVVSGISGNVDLNESYKDYPHIIKSKGLNGFNFPSSNYAATLYKTYEIKKGDTLWGISEKLLGSGSKYKQIMDLNSLTNDLIFPGQILNIP